MGFLQSRKVLWSWYAAGYPSSLWPSLNHPHLTVSCQNKSQLLLKVHQKKHLAEDGAMMQLTEDDVMMILLAKDCSMLYNDDIIDDVIDQRWCYDVIDWRWCSGDVTYSLFSLVTVIKCHLPSLYVLVSVSNWLTDPCLLLVTTSLPPTKDKANVFCCKYKFIIFHIF